MKTRTCPVSERERLKLQSDRPLSGPEAEALWTELHGCSTTVLVEEVPDSEVELMPTVSTDLLPAVRTEKAVATKPAPPRTVPPVKTKTREHPFKRAFPWLLVVAMVVTVALQQLMTGGGTVTKPAPATQKVTPSPAKAPVAQQVTPSPSGTPAPSGQPAAAPAPAPAPASQPQPQPRPAPQVTPPPAQGGGSTPPSSPPPSGGVPGGDSGSSGNTRPGPVTDQPSAGGTAPVGRSPDGTGGVAPVQPIGGI